LFSLLLSRSSLCVFEMGVWNKLLELLYKTQNPYISHPPDECLCLLCL
jgi:hypothetical protein